MSGLPAPGRGINGRDGRIKGAGASLRDGSSAYLRPSRPPEVTGDRAGQGRGPVQAAAHLGPQHRKCNDLLIADIDRLDLALHVSIELARPWRATTREGGIYRLRRVDDRRSSDRRTR